MASIWLSIIGVYSPALLFLMRKAESPSTLLTSSRERMNYQEGDLCDFRVHGLGATLRRLAFHSL